MVSQIKAKIDEEQASPIGQFEKVINTRSTNQKSCFTHRAGFTGNSKMPLSNKDLDKFREDNKKEMKELMTEVFRQEINSLIEPLKATIQNNRDEIESIKAAAQQAKSDAEVMIVTEPQKQKERESQLFITGIKSKDEVTNLLKDILQAEPEVKFCKLLEARKNDEVSTSADSVALTKNCLIGLKGQQAMEVLTLKAQYLKTREELKHIGILQSLTPLQARVRKKLHKELQKREEMDPAPAGKKYIIRNGQIILMNIKPKN